MKRQTIVEAFVFVLVVLVGSQLRVALQWLPNFAPVAALALFSGYFFRRRLVAIAAPLSVMAISDLQIGGYDWRMMAVVYGMLAAPVALRGVLRRRLTLVPGKLASTAAPVCGLAACSLLAALLFFLVTNFFTWLWSGMYQPTLPGLAHCYAMALPFFRYTVAGDLFFAFTLFGGYALAVSRGMTPSVCPTPLSDAAG